MAAKRTYGDDIREAIHQLVNIERRPATSITPDLQARFGVSPSLQHIREIARKEDKDHKPPISKQPKDAQLQRLIAGIVNAIDRALDAAEQDPASIDGDELLKLARTVREIEPLLKPEPQKGNDQAQPQSVLGRLQTIRGTDTANPTPPTTDAVRSHVAGVDGVNMGGEAA